MSRAKQTLPEYVHPLGVRFRVELVDKVDEEESAGETYAHHRVIKIANEMDTKRRWSTLLHEYIHASLHVTGLDAVISDELNEVIAQSLEFSLEQFLRAHGKELVAAMQQEEDAP